MPSSMAKITIVRNDVPKPPESFLSIIREFLFGFIDGFSKDDKPKWRRAWKTIINLEPGEMMVIEIIKPRSGPFHRRHMKIEQTVFDSQERFMHFEKFRDWLKIGAGHCELVPGPKGAIVPIPNSIDYASIDDEDFRTFHENTIRFLRGGHAAKVLWPHLKNGKGDEMMDAVLNEFGE